MQASYLNYLFRVALFITDLILINLAFWFAFSIVDTYKALSDPLYRHYLLVFNMIWFFSANIFRMYSEENSQSSETIFRTTWRALLAQATLFVFYLTFTKDVNISRQFILFMYGFMLLSFTASRFITTVMEITLKRRLGTKKPVAVLGKNRTGKYLAVFFKDPKNDFQFEGFLHEENNLYMDNEGHILPEISKAIESAAKKGIKEIYVPLSIEQIVEAKHLLREAEKQLVRLKFIPLFLERSFRAHLKVDYMGEFPVISLRKEPLEDTNNRLRKRFFDIFFSGLVILFLLSWLYPIMAMIIKIQSRGPVLFKQLRSGRDNETFTCYKFRTMYLNKDSDVLQAIENDERITSFGKFMRKTSLDELPQFFNVFKGEMSVVGPRPHMLKHTEEYSAVINMFMVRHFMKPGITGWAQVSGFRGQTSSHRQMRSRVEHDIWYLENWSSMLDVKIIFLTIINIFKGEKNAY
jgi:putative colanic acid biosynthesis UDP-glucose lipid carrier transferase